MRERRAPFNPSEVVAEFAATLKSYHVDRVVGDRYGGEWPRERFRDHAIAYDAAEKTKSEYYLAVLPQVNSGTVELLDHARLVGELCALERRTARGGRDSVDHPPGGRDDLINAAAGALVRAAERSRGWTVLDDGGDDLDQKPLNPMMKQIRQAFPFAFDRPSSLTCGQCANRTTKERGTWCNLRYRFIQDQQPACDFFDLRAHMDT